ncbi:PREDICTED: protein NKG7 [Elephantulus edwardii]|uniref:protein NKG7 n=1 Tax=Elephantulus edwardii TaxID=28737 RepID=UPI0003F0B606|nr:PREDICTED: protein NKG7 [Elephantulus edwardii]
MEPYISLALLADLSGLVTNLVSLSTNFWVEVMGPGFSIHAGLWLDGPAADFIRVTQAFTIIAALLGLVSLVMLLWHYIPWLIAPDRVLMISAVTALSAASSMLVAMSVYTAKRWEQILPPQIFLFFSWSFYLGWVSNALIFCAALLILFAQYGSRRAGYGAL